LILQVELKEFQSLFSDLKTNEQNRATAIDYQKRSFFRQGVTKTKNG